MFLVGKKNTTNTLFVYSFHKNRSHGYIQYIPKYSRKHSLLLRILTETPWHQADKSKPLSVKARADRSKISGEPALISRETKAAIFSGQKNLFQPPSTLVPKPHPIFPCVANC